MKQIDLRHGYFALVDDEDYNLVAELAWFPLKRRTRNGGDCIVYAAHNMPRGTRRGGGRKCVLMHRVILGLRSDELLVDHLNSNGLDNRRCNLRICSHTENMRNRRLHVNNSSGYKGVYARDSGKWIANIHVDRKQIHLGTFDSREEAAEAYDDAARKYHGEFARLNFGNIDLSAS